RDPAPRRSSDVLPLNAFAPSSSAYRPLFTKRSPKVSPSGIEPLASARRARRRAASSRACLVTYELTPATSVPPRVGSSLGGHQRQVLFFKRRPLAGRTERPGVGSSEPRTASAARAGPRIRLAGHRPRRRRGRAERRELG